MQSDILALLGMALILYSVFFYNSAVPFPSLYTLVPILGSMLIILFADRGTWTARALSAAPMVWVGIVSYSAYLWHQPLFAFARIRTIGEPSLWMMSGLSLMTLALAYLTMRYVETPFRRRRLLAGRRGLLSASVAGIAAIAAFGLVGTQTGGFANRLDAQTPGYLADLHAQLKAGGTAQECEDGAGFAALKMCRVYSNDAPTARVAILGDSHAGFAIPGFADMADSHQLDVFAATHGACPPLLGVYLAKGGDHARECHDFVQRTAQDVIAQDIKTVYLVARWSLYATGEYADTKATYALSDRFGARNIAPAERIRNFETALNDTLEFYRAAGIRVVLVGQVPLQWVAAQTVIEQAMLMRLDHSESRKKFDNSYVEQAVNNALTESADGILHKLALQHGAEVLHLADHFADGNRYGWMRDGQVLYRDTNHLSPGGALSLGPLFVRSYAAR